MAFLIDPQLSYLCHYPIIPVQILFQSRLDDLVKLIEGNLLHRWYPGQGLLPAGLLKDAFFGSKCKVVIEIHAEKTIIGVFKVLSR
jgi:hypothetical protein